MVLDMPSDFSQAYSIAIARPLTVLGINAHSRTHVSIVGAVLVRTPVVLRPLVPPWVRLYGGRIRLCAEGMPDMLLDTGAYDARWPDVTKFIKRSRDKYYAFCIIECQLCYGI